MGVLSYDVRQIVRCKIGLSKGAVRMTRTARAPLSRERILDAAVAIADAEGLAAVTMRGVAQQLDCEAMSLYYHVKDKAQLVAGLVEVIIDEVIAVTLDSLPGCLLYTSPSPRD